MSMNKVILLGNLGRDPETVTTKGGTSIVKLSLATSHRYTTQSGEKREETEWHRVTFFGKQGEVIAEYLSKGDQLLVEGRIKTTKFTDKNGVEKYSTDIIGDAFSFVGGAKGGGGKSSTPAPQNDPAGQPQFHDDDIPF